MEKKENNDTAVEAIIESAEVMQKIVFDVLDFAKPIVLEVKAQDTRDIVKKSCEACKLKAAENGTSLTLDLPSQSVMAEVDGFRVERALANLINNAIEASGKGQHVRITMSIEKTHVLIIIQDNGAGMDRETLENIFIPYYTKKSSGSGLGMPIAKKIIEGHKGKILIDSKPGRGTKVGVYLPKVSSPENIDST
jgi:signal transduction histidine kinase